MTVKTRFATSPTGFLHVGGARTALYSWLFAKHMGGEFVLRIEDTDLERSTQEAIDAILEGMEWLGLNWDEGPYYQTKRFDRYNQLIDQLLAEDKAYKCYCPKELLDELRFDFAMKYISDPVLRSTFNSSLGKSREQYKSRFLSSKAQPV